jgi:hypothetical protein
VNRLDLRNPAALMAWALFFALAPAAPPPPSDVSPIVQVGINYGPGKSTMVSGFLVAEGRLVMTQANLLEGAREIAVALSNTDVLDAEVERIDAGLNVAWLRVPHRARAELTPMPDLPAGEISAKVVGSPTAFHASTINVRLVPSGDPPRWKIEPPLAPAFRGAALLSISGTLLGIAIQQAGNGAIVGLPSAQFAALWPELGGEAAAEARQVQVPNPTSQVPGSGPQSPKSDSGVEEVPAPPALSGIDAGPSSRRVTAMLADLPPWSIPMIDLTSAKASPAPSAPAGPVSGQSATAQPQAAAHPPTPAPAPAPAPRHVVSGAAAAGEPAAQPETLEAFIKSAEALTEKARFYEAVEVLDKAREKYPRAPDVYWHLAHAYWQQALHKRDGQRRASMEAGAYRKSMAAFEVFLKIAPNDPRAPQARYRLESLRKVRRQ